MIQEGEVAKYRKKKSSGTSKSKNKAGHKHEYVDCLFATTVLCKKELQKPLISTGSYCKFCGKIGYSRLQNSEKTEDGYWRRYTQEELLEKYKGLEIIQTSDILQKFVYLERNNNYEKTREA